MLLHRLALALILLVPASVLAQDPSGVENAVIDLPDIYPGEALKLTDGLWEKKTAIPGGASETYTVRLDPDHRATADLNDDGQPEAVGIVTSGSSRGTGSFRDLIVFERGAESWRSIAKANLGDRVIVRDLAVTQGTVTLNVLAHGPRDGLCCPSQAETWRFEFSSAPKAQLVRQ